MKIVHIDTALDIRGGQQQLLLLARGLKERGHEQLIVCPEGSLLETGARREGFSVFALPAHDPLHAHGVLALRQELTANPVEILHAHDGRGQTLAWLASLAIPVRRVASRRVTFLPKGTWPYRLQYGRASDAIIAVSGFVRKLLVNSGLPESKIEVIPDGVELPPELPGAELRYRVRAQWGFSEQEFLVGHVGAFTAEKGQDIAIEGTVALAERLPQLRLLLAGEGPLRSSPSITSKLQASQGRVRLLGTIENLAEFFAGLDLFLMPSRAEGLGSSALMAMAHGLAVIASRVGGLAEIVEEGKTGWLVPPESPSALADTLAAAASDRARLRQFGLMGRERARQFSSDIMIERTEGLYRRLLGVC